MASEDYSGLIRFEDDHILVANKPAGWNTHAPGLFAGEGLYEWLVGREPRWQNLAILHRLDKETSGLIVFGKSVMANRSLTQQFTDRLVHKRYLLLTDRPVPSGPLLLNQDVVRAGDRYVSRPPSSGPDRAQTRFERCGESDGQTLVQAWPLTGRTHQIRVHAATAGFPILGDSLYGGSPAPRVYLQAAHLAFAHPATSAPFEQAVPSDFNCDPRLSLRTAIINPQATDAYRLVHGNSDGWPGWCVDRLGQTLLAQSETEPTPALLERLRVLMAATGASSVYHKVLQRQVRQAPSVDSSPRHLLGLVAPEPLVVRENGLSFDLSLNEGYSVGLFLDQRDNRRRLLTNYVGKDFALSTAGGAPPEVLNTFAYTCAFSVAAARAGARVTSLDLSKKYLAWGERNFTQNSLTPAAHEFIAGDVFDWARRWGKKQRRFDLVLLDPPTFSSSKVSGVFRAEKDYARLVGALVPLLNPGGVLFVSCNAARFAPEDFLAQVSAAITAAGRKIRHRHYVPQPPDFPISRAEPGYLKTCWYQLD